MCHACNCRPYFQNFYIIQSIFFSIAWTVKFYALGIKSSWHKICTQSRYESIQNQRYIRGGIHPPLFPRGLTAWAPGCAAVQPWTRAVRSLIGGTFSLEMLSRWDSWSLHKLHGSSTMHNVYQWPRPWLAALISRLDLRLDSSFQSCMMIWTVGWTWLPSPLVSEVTAPICLAATALSPSFAGQLMVGPDFPLLPLGVCSSRSSPLQNKIKEIHIFNLVTIYSCWFSCRTEEHQCLLTIRKGLHVLIKSLFDFL